MTSVPPPRPGIRYTPQQVERMRQAHPNYRMPGHVLRIDEDGMTTFVPWDQASFGGARDPGRPQDRRDLREYSFDPKQAFDVAPIQKRTPQERVESMTRHMAPDTVGKPTIPGLTDEKVRELVGESWKRGQPLTGDQVRAAAASLLQQAERKFETTEAKKVTRTAPSD